MSNLPINQIICGDCLDIMKELPDESIDMILCDLPYGITRCKWDSIIPLEPLWKEYKRIIKDNGPIVLTASEPFTSILVTSNLDMFKYDLIWNKGRVSGFLNASKMPLRNHESILVFYKKLPVYNPQFFKGEPLHGMGKTTEGKNNVYGKFSIKDNPSRFRDGDTKKYPRSIINITKSHNFLHPTQKPVKLFEYFILTYSNESDIILDNCIGSGTTAIAAIRNNRRFIGIDISEEYCELSRQRINNELNQGDLFRTI